MRRNKDLGKLKGALIGAMENAEVKDLVIDERK
jgi:hypothetical protein